MQQLLTNLVLKHPAIAAPQVIIYVSQSMDVVASINAEDKGTLEVLDNFSPQQLLPIKLTPAMNARQVRAWETIEPLVVRTPEIFEASKRRELILARAEQVKTNPDTIRNWMAEYWQRGCTPSALAGVRHKCGRHRTLSSVTAASPKLGRPRTRAPGVGLNVDEKALKYFRVAIAQIFHKNKRITVYQTYLKVLRLYFPEAVRTDEKGKVKVVNIEGIPTYRQFLYWVHKETDEFTTVIAKRGLDFYQKTLRPP